MKSPRYLSILISGLLFFTGVIGVAAQDGEPADEKAKPASIRVEKEDQFKEDVSRMRDGGSERYRIGYEDVLKVDVYRHPELSQTVKVARDGTIILPRINEPIVAVCKTERELASAVTAFYRNYLRNPFVNVRALEQRSQPIAVTGAVNKPGGLYLNRRARLLEVLALAGGPDYEQSGAYVQVARTGNLSSCETDSDATRETRFFQYLLDDVMSGKDNPYVQPGDIVGILAAKEAYVVGNVVEPTTIKLKDQITLTQAIAKAGGLTKNAKTSKVVIERRSSGSRIKEDLVYDLKKIRAREVEDPYLQANDIIMVSTDTSKAIRNGLLDLFTRSVPNILWRFPN